MTRWHKAINACSFDYEIQVAEFSDFVAVVGSIGGDILSKRVYFDKDDNIIAIRER